MNNQLRGLKYTFLCIYSFYTPNAPRILKDDHIYQIVRLAHGMGMWKINVGLKPIDEIAYLSNLHSTLSRAIWLIDMC
jgi:hypothetical protein